MSRAPSSSTTMQRARAWSGPALFSYGFRPFFLGGALWAAMAMALWIGMLAGWLDLPTRFDPVSWHAHEFLFGYVGAVAAGFLMTAVPNWTGRLPIVGWPLIGLAALWALGRAAVSLSGWASPLMVAAADLAFPLLLLLAMGREVIAARNWRNLKLLAAFAVFLLANALFHWEAAQGEFAAEGAGLRLGLSAALMLVAVVGGRITPSFTRNWLKKNGSERMPTPPEQRFDQVALLLLTAALALWVLLPERPATGLALLAAGIAHLARLARWRGLATLREPLVWILHAGYAFLPLGALTQAATILRPALLGPAPAQHIWMAGALGVMTLAVMSRATLGHTGRALTAGPATVAIYLCGLASVLARLAAGLIPDAAHMLHMASGGLWIAAFAGFAAVYGPMALRPRADK